MNRLDRLSPTLNGRRQTAMPQIFEQIRVQRRPNLSSVVDGSPDLIPNSTKNHPFKEPLHQRQSSNTIMANNSKKITIKKPQGSTGGSKGIFDISKLAQQIGTTTKLSEKLSPTSNQNSTKNLYKKQNGKNDSKENLQPNISLSTAMNMQTVLQRISHNSSKQDILGKQRKSSKSQHDQETLGDLYQSKTNFNNITNITNNTSTNAEYKLLKEKAIKINSRTLSQENNQTKKTQETLSQPQQVKIELDFSCRDQSHNRSESTTVVSTSSHQQKRDSLTPNPTRTADDILKDFKPIDQFGFDEETLLHLYKREQVYQVTPNYERMQPHTNMVMRAVLIDWLTEVCKEFTLKRETLHLAIHNYDRYMARREGVPRAELQLVGISALYIACKIEEIYPPKVSDFSQASNYGFTTKQILEKELEMCKVLKWFLNPPTLYLWTTWYMTQWDLFVTQSQKLQKSQRTFHFKQPNHQSYILFRQYMNILDCTLLDIKTFNYSNREIVASLIFLINLKQYLGINLQKLYEILNSKTQSKEIFNFQSVYQEFVEMCFGLSMQHILKCIRYLTHFLQLEMVIGQPSTSKIPQEKEFEEHYEYFLSIQTHSANNLAFVRSRITKNN